MASPKAERPLAARTTKSFSRLDSSKPNHQPRSRASTLQNGMTAASMISDLTTSPLDEKTPQNDIFEKGSLVSGEEGSVRDVSEVDSPEIPDGFDELPIELVSLIDRFIDSLTAKVHNTPPSIEKLSDIFQDFYTKAESHIATHISALSARQSRGSSPAASVSSKSSITGRDGRKLQSSSSRDTLGSPEQQMLTPKEISDRRKVRRLLDRKGLALEEAVERRVCERIYKRIWRHRSTLDEVRDEKLRSRTAALALVGIGLRDLGITLDSSITDESDIEEGISKAREGLLQMNYARYPLGKLQQLTLAHKNIVDLLTTIHQSSSSADEILPTLIYTLITTPPEGINVISNLQFIQRFRSSSKIDGEAAYCLTNLEAAITFLETVDLASLRSDEALEGPPKSSSRPTTPHDELRRELPPKTPTSASHYGSSVILETTPQDATSHPLQSPSLKPTPSATSSHNRRLSNLLHPPTNALGAASDAVRNSADQGIKTIGSTLDSSFKLLFGRLREQKLVGDNVDAEGTIIVPKTLDDARKLVEPKPSEDEDSILPRPRSSSLGLSLTKTPPTKSPSTEDALLSALAGRRNSPRDRSTDSNFSSGSGTRKPLPSTPTSNPRALGTSSPTSPIHTTTHTDTLGVGSAAVESMRSLGNTLNPLKNFGGMNVMRGFGRSSAASSSASVPTLSTAANAEKADRDSQAAASTGSSSRDKTSSETPSSLGSVGGLGKIQRPVQRFLDVGGVEELRMGEVGELLAEYRRLVGVLENLGAF